MPSHLSADRPSAQPPGRGSVEALISQTRRLKGDVDAVRRGAQAEGTDPRERWQRALYDLALHQLDDLDTHLAQLRDGPLPAPAPAPAPQTARAWSGSLLSRVGSAEWNLLTDEADWSGELYQILGRDPGAGPLTLDELPSLVVDEDRPKLTAMVTDCLVDARPIDGEFRIARPDGPARTVHIMGEPVLDADGSTASMWAVLRDVSELRRSQRVVSETRDSLRRDPPRPQDGHRAGTEPQKAAPPSRPGFLRLPSPHRSAPLELAAGGLPDAGPDAWGRYEGRWYDACDLADGDLLLSMGTLTPHAAVQSPDPALLLGTLRGLAMAGTGPGPLLEALGRLLDATGRPALAGAVCCRYRPGTRTLVWAHTGHPAPLLFRDGTGRRLDAEQQGQAEQLLEPGDLLVLPTAEPGDIPRDPLALGPRLAEDRTAQDAVHLLLDEFGASGPLSPGDEPGVLVARVTP
ncbi:SpoIIE family protein phosphatase [Streptomyces poriticola]|uniref:SpoIIE family protein phosphatase n=1 Tax=Streptomyces poriticola TaxID=3120506 RepID=UPI002FCE5437